MEASERQARLLLGSVFLVAAAGLVYELIAGTLTTYLMGSSVMVFSIVSGVFMAAMGLGAWPLGAPCPQRSVGLGEMGSETCS